MSYETYRTLNGLLNLICAGGLLTMAVWLLWRGGHERPYWRPIPGRIVVGAFLFTYGVARVEEGFWRVIVSGPVGQVGQRVNEPWTITLLAVACVLCGWSFLRFLRNDLDVSDDTV